MLSPLTLSALAGLASFFIVMGLLRPQGSLFAASSTDGIIQAIDLKLRKAGITTVSPSVVMLAAAAICAVVGLALMFATGNPLVGVLAAGIVPVLMSFDLDRRARSRQEKIFARLVPFLRKVESQVRSNHNPARAFENAVTEDKLLAWVLRDQIAELQMNRPLAEVLRDTVQEIPMRPWVQFVRSMTVALESGGQLAEILASNVERINSHVLLRQRLMGDVAQFRGQQFVILGFSVVIPGLLYMSAPDIFGVLFTHPMGIMAILGAVAMDLLAFKIIQAAINDIERRLDA